MISDEDRARIRRLYFGEHWKVGTIAAQLGLHHETVARALKVDSFSSRSRVGPSALDPFVPFVREQLERYPKLTATRVHEMVRLRGYPGSVQQLRRRIRQLGLRPRPTPEAFFMLTTLPGEQGQVDWGHFGTVRVGRGTRKLFGLVVVLSWSSAVRAYFGVDQTMTSVMRGHVQAFDYFGGVPRTLLYDNMKTVVLDRDGDAIRYHPRFLQLAGHYLFEGLPCRPARGNEKGRVERAIRYLRTSFFEGRHFADLADVREQFGRWRDDVAHARPCPRDKTVTVAEALETERDKLLKLPAQPIDTSDVRVTVARKQPYVIYDGNRYSIPWQLVGQSLTVLGGEHRIRVVHDGEVVASHHRSWERGQVVEQPEHLAGLLESKRKAGPLKGRQRIIDLVPEAEALYQALLSRNESTGSHTVKLERLLDDYGLEVFRSAILEALDRGTPRADSVAYLLEKRRGLVSTERRPRWGRPELDDLTVTHHNLEDYDDI